MLQDITHEPGVAEDDSCPANTIDMEGGSPQVTHVLDNEVNNLSIVTCFIEGFIYVIDRNGLGEGLGA